MLVACLLLDLKHTYDICYDVCLGMPRMTLSLGMPKAPQGNIQGRLKRPSLGMPRMTSPLSSSKPSVYLTRSYIFIRHMICVLLGAYFNFTCCLTKIIGSEILIER